MQNIDQYLEEYDLLHMKEEILKIAASSIGIVKENVSEDDIPVGSSKFGGLPDLPSNFSFPVYNDGYLTFLVQLNLEEAKPFDKNNLLPNKGILYFFYDIMEQPWGMDEEDEGCFKVLYFDGHLEQLKRTPYPEETEDYFPLPAYKVVFDERFTFPEEFEGMKWNDEGIEDFYEFREHIMQETEEDVSHPMHYMLGQPFNIQNDIFEEIVYYENKEKLSWNSKEIRSKAEELVLLFQMDSDDDLEVMWGDAGILYFCINKEDLQKKQFDQVKFTLQCY
ncbi:YwqG family protein [Metabacillus fastidiosus]|uniref:YwqG family protein n=1 Tax=Metabacillus fastidiosus TaxID=1458 RepID=UPI003D2C32BD